MAPAQPRIRRSTAYTAFTPERQRRLKQALAFNPAKGDLFRSLVRFDPVNYRPRQAGLPFEQVAERRLMHEVRDGVGEVEKQTALMLADVGLGSIWHQYASQIGLGRRPEEQSRIHAGLHELIEGAIELTEQKKQAFNSPRPYIADRALLAYGRPPGGTSHPSGHAATAFAAATFLSHFAPARRDEFFSAAGNVARSRVVVGAHYPGDVAVGARLGLEYGAQKLGEFLRAGSWTPSAA